MATLKETKSRISSVQSTLKITSAMKMVSSAKLHHAQGAMGSLIPYEQGLHLILKTLLESGRNLQELGVDPRYFSSSCIWDDPVHGYDAGSVHGSGSAAEHGYGSFPEHRRRVALVVISSNSSLCGAFNSNVIRLFNAQMSGLRSEGLADSDIDIYPVGRKIADAVKKAGLSARGNYTELADKPSYDSARALAKSLCEDYLSGSIDEVRLLYNHFASTASQPSCVETFLPFSVDVAGGDSGESRYIIEPDAEEIASELLPKVILLKFYTILLDANAAEHAARVVAMQMASDNAEKLLAELTLEYNKRRQQAITNEILDIVSGSMA